MSRAKRTPREAYLAKLDRDLKRAHPKPSAFLQLKWCAAQCQEPMAVNRLCMCGGGSPSFFFYRLDDERAAQAGYKIESGAGDGLYQACDIDDGFMFVTAPDKQALIDEQNAICAANHLDWQIRNGVAQ